MFRFADSQLTDNATGLVACSMSEPPENMNRIELFGTHGSMRIDNLGELFVAGRGETEWKQVDVDEPIAAEAGDTGFSYGFKYIAAKIVDAISVGSKTVDGAATFADGVRIQQVLDAARESDKAGGRVSLQNARLSSSSN
jgi:predicted dehydrogenase